MAISAVDPNVSSMEVVLIDKYADSRLKQFESKVLELYYARGLTLELVQKLAGLVSDFMGYVQIIPSQIIGGFVLD